MGTGLLSWAAIVLIMSPLFNFDWARNHCLLVVISLLSCLVGAYVLPVRTSMNASGWWVLGVAFCVSLSLIVIPFLWRGTTLYNLFYITVLQHKDFARHWYGATPRSGTAVLASVLSLGVALLWVWSGRAHREIQTLRLGLHGLKGVLGLTWAFFFVASDLVLSQGPSEVSWLLFKGITPFLWLTLVPPSREESTETAFARIGLSFMAVFIALYPFPVAGSQTMFATIPMVIITAVFLNDAMISLGAAFHLDAVTRRTRELTAGAAILVLGGLYVHDLRSAHSVFAGLVPLNLPEATRVRVTSTEFETYHWITDQINRRCESFFTMPGLFSLNFWTKKDSPTTLVMNDWPFFLNDEQQNAIVRDLIRHSTACIIHNPEIVEFLRRGQDITLSPVYRYIQSKFKTVDERNGYYLMIQTIDGQASGERKPN